MSFSLSTGNTVSTASSAAVSSSTDAAATIKVTATAGITNGWIQSTGVVAKIYINGSLVATKTVIGNGTYTTAGNKSVSATKSITKTTAAQSIPWKVEYWQYTDGVEQSLKETDSGTVSVAAKPSYKVSYNANGGSLGSVPSSQTKWYGEALTLSTAKPTRTGYTFLGWGTASNDASVDYAAGASYTANQAITLYAIWKVVAPSAPSGLKVTRNSDNKNTLSWTRGSNADVTYSSIKVERRVDGGAWSQIASVAGTATSYADTATSADHAYEYRIRASNSTGNSAYATCATVLYNTPSAPTGVTAARSGETAVELTIANAARTATALEIQRSTDGATWETVSTVDGSPVKSASDNPGGGTFYYRARNKRGSLASAWSPASNAVVTICAPAAPTLKSPASGSVVSKAQETVTFEHAHNPIDGSAQTAAQYRISTDRGASFDYIDIDGDAQGLEVENTFAVNAEVTWAVRTKGAHDDFGPWSDNRTFFVYQAPSVAFAQPADDFVIENTPIVIELQYDDASGSLVSATLTVSDEARTVYTRDMGAETECEISAAEWTPENGKTYTLSVTARSSSSLSATATREVTVSFVLPHPPMLEIANDPETGYVSLVAQVDDSNAELEPAASISLWRESENGRVLLGDRLQAGSAVVDKYAPLNVDYSYVAATYADSGAANSVTFANRLVTPWFFFLFGDDLARARWNPSGDVKLKRPAKRRVFYAGRKDPVSYDGYNKSDERSLSALLQERSEGRAFERLMDAGGRGVYKSGDGDVLHADFDVTLTPAFSNPGFYGTLKAGIVKIDGGDL